MRDCQRLRGAIYAAWHILIFTDQTVQSIKRLALCRDPRRWRELRHVFSRLEEISVRRECRAVIDRDGSALSQVIEISCIEHAGGKLDFDQSIVAIVELLCEVGIVVVVVGLRDLITIGIIGEAYRVRTADSIAVK